MGPMRAFISFCLSAVLASPALAQTAPELDGLIAGSRAEAEEAVLAHKEELRRLIDEAAGLKQKIAELKVEIERASSSRNRLLVISAGFAAVFVAVARVQPQGGDLTQPMASFARMIKMGVTGIGAIGFGGAASYTHFGVVVKDKSKLLRFEVQLAEVQRLLEERLAAME